MTAFQCFNLNKKSINRLCVLVPLLSREHDELDEEVLSVCKEVSKHFFNGNLKPEKDDILKGYKDLVSDAIFSAIGSVTARKIAQKEF